MGGPTSVSYIVLMSIDNFIFTLVAMDLTDTEYTVNNLIVGSLYWFKIRSKNDFGESKEFSETI